MKKREKNIPKNFIELGGRMILMLFLFSLCSCVGEKIIVKWDCYDYYQNTASHKRPVGYITIENNYKNDTIVFVAGKSYCSFKYKNVIGEEDFKSILKVENDNNSLLLTDGCNESIRLIPPKSKVEVELFVYSVERRHDNIYQVIDSILTDGKLIYIAPFEEISKIESWRSYNKMTRVEVTKNKESNCCYDNHKTMSKEYIEIREDLGID